MTAPDHEARLIGTLPPRSGKVVSMSPYRDSLVITCEYGDVYQVTMGDFDTPTLESVYYSRTNNPLDWSGS